MLHTSSSNDITAGDSTKASSPNDEVNESPPKYSWYHGVFFNATIVGIAAFAAPGLWNAMNSVGAGGQQTPYLVMAGNAILFAVMTLTCLTASMMANRVGLRNSLVFGTVGFVIYSAALYTNNRYGTEWFIYFGSAICGLSSGIFWGTEGAIMLTYPEPEKRGRYLAYWLSYRNSGSILGGIINLAFNYQGKSTGKLDWRTYIVFVALQCLGPLCSLLLTPPEKVIRRNGSRIQLAERIPDLEELKALMRVLLRKDFLLVMPYFLYITWTIPYITTYLSLYFSVRSRALASLVSAVAQVVTTLLFGAFLDWTRLSLNKRARYGYVAMMALIGGCWVWGAIVQNEYTRHKPALDWVDSGFGKGWALYIFWQINFSLTYNFGFWLLSFLARDSKEIIRYVSVARAVESAGQCISSGISSTSVPLISALGVCFALWGIAVIAAYFVVRQVGITHIGPEKEAPNADESNERSEKS
ncbi:MFS general substrate transporter [Daldinia caldariorum]|uniref:MFS general substrate transporter n=1 Tax=Daldinia caldariorum TaxID=326644 RepID=UPI002008C318|nr:MFS general substrate transporter [Daldinia caldariorum]KAI1470551.1 MFS general substrate transporter [Daldinia caldariorum]